MGKPSPSGCATPTRGAQGNALKTVVGLPHALGGDAAVIITACGVRHTIRVGLDLAGEVRVDHDETEVPARPGTAVDLCFPAAGQDFAPEFWARAFAAVNPHAAVKIRVSRRDGEHAHERRPRGTHSYHPLVNNGWRKFLPTGLPSPHWYDATALERLVGATVAEAQRTGIRPPTLREFVRKQFQGLTGTAKAKGVCNQFPNVRTLADGARAPDQVVMLLVAMQAATSPPHPEVLGALGRDVLEKRLDAWYGVERFWYAKVDGEHDGIPFVFEIAVAETRQPGNLITGINFAPTFGDPLAGARLTAGELDDYGLRGLLTAAHVLPRWDGDDPPAAVIAHLSCPVVHFLDRGKTRLDLPDPVRAAIARATGNGDYPVCARTLYYQVRPLIQDYTAADLDYGYFSQTLLTRYQAEREPIDALYYDPRGELHEPHRRETVRLGTREVESYQVPDYEYNKVLYIEKKGLWPILERAQLAQRYDLAVIAAEGYATAAARLFLREAGRRHGVQIFVLHDADPYGYNIARTQAEATRRMPDHTVDVIDLGLCFEEALALGLMQETFNRTAALPEGLILTDRERQAFEGKWGGKKQYVCQRVELNAFAAPDLTAFIERKLAEAGATGKVIPPDAVLQAQTEVSLRAAVEDAVGEAIAAVIRRDRLTDAAVATLRPVIDLSRVRQSVEDGLAEDPTHSWRGALADSLRVATTAQIETLRELVREEIGVQAEEIDDEDAEDDAGGTDLLRPCWERSRRGRT